MNSLEEVFSANNDIDSPNLYTFSPMEEPIITFKEIIKLNDHDWDRAYAVLNHHLDTGNLKKEVMDNGLVIYHNPSKVQTHNLIHDNLFLSTADTQVVMRPRRNRISRGEGNR